MEKRFFLLPAWVQESKVSARLLLHFFLSRHNGASERRGICFFFFASVGTIVAWVSSAREQRVRCIKLEAVDIFLFLRTNRLCVYGVYLRQLSWITRYNATTPYLHISTTRRECGERCVYKVHCVIWFFRRNLYWIVFRNICLIGRLSASSIIDVELRNISYRKVCFSCRVEKPYCALCENWETSNAYIERKSSPTFLVSSDLFEKIFYA